jgi:hypothetical protein
MTIDKRWHLFIQKHKHSAHTSLGNFSCHHGQIEDFLKIKLLCLGHKWSWLLHNIDKVSQSLSYTFLNCKILKSI